MWSQDEGELRPVHGEMGNGRDRECGVWGEGKRQPLHGHATILLPGVSLPGPALCSAAPIIDIVAATRSERSYTSHEPTATVFWAS